MPATDGTRRIVDHFTAFDGAYIGMPMLGNARQLSIKATGDATVNIILKNIMVDPATKEFFKVTIEKVEPWDEGDTPFLVAPEPSSAE